MAVPTFQMLMAIFVEVFRIFSVTLGSILAVRPVVHLGVTLVVSVILSDTLCTGIHIYSLSLTH